MESRLRASPEQFSLMLEFMERHGDLSRPQPGLQGRLRGECMWQELADMLNSVGGSGVNKTAEKWKRVWSDWKTKTKKKASTINRDIHGTDGGSAKSKSLNPLEERVTSHTHPLLERISSPVDDIESVLLPSVPDHANYTLDPLAPAQAPVESTPVPPQPAASTIPPVPGPSNRTIQARLRGFGLTYPRRRRIRQRCRRQTPFDWGATNEFVAIEESRLRLERERDERLFELESERCKIESERLRLDAQRIQLDHERVRIEGERVRIEEERTQVESKRIKENKALRESNEHLNNNVKSLLSRLAAFFESSNRGNRPH